MIGLQQQQPLAGLPGLRGASVVQTPVVQGFFPPVDESIWCMEWLPGTQAQQPAAELIEHVETLMEIGETAA